MNLEKLNEEEYVYQHFNMTSKLYQLTLNLTVNEFICELFDKLKKRVEEESNGPDLELSDAWEMVKEDIDESIKTIEEPSKQFFSIPNNVLLPEDSVHKYTKHEVDELKAEVKKNKKMFTKQKTYIALLEKEMSDLEATNPLKLDVDKLLQNYEDTRAKLTDLKNVAKDFDKQRMDKKDRKLQASRFASDQNK